MKILVRLPNWLGDMVMSVALMRQLPHFFPGARVSVIAKKGIHDLLPFFPALEHRFIFDKQEYKGIKGLVKFGKEIKETENFDLFICLPDSLSAAVMGLATGATERIGYKKEMRQVLLSSSFSKPEGLHRVEEYIRLVELHTALEAEPPMVRLDHQFPKKDYLVVNINSEASSRRLTPEKAVEILNTISGNTDLKIVLIGAPKEKEFIESVLSGVKNPDHFDNMAGKTSLVQLAEVLASARLMLTTDSGPAHLANSLGTHTVVLFGAGNENNTAPYNKSNRTVIRLGELSCEPCEKNICYRFATPQCLERLNVNLIAETVKMHTADGQKFF